MHASLTAGSGSLNFDGDHAAIGRQAGNVWLTGEPETNETGVATVLAQQFSGTRVRALDARHLGMKVQSRQDDPLDIFFQWSMGRPGLALCAFLGLRSRLEQRRLNGLRGEVVGPGAAGHGWSILVGVSTLTFDTLKFADTLKQAGVPPAQAEAEARAVAAAIGEVDVATKRDIDDVRREMMAMEQRLVIKLGGIVAVATGIVLAVMRLPH